MRKVPEELARVQFFADLNALFGGPHGVKGLGYLYQPTYRDKKTGEMKHSSVWWWDPPGNLPKVSTGRRDKQDAEDWRIQRLAELGRGSSIGIRRKALTFEDLCTMLENDHIAKGRRSARVVKCRLKFLRRRFGGRLATDIPDDEVTAYVAQRRKEGAAVATINVELRWLRRMFRLGAKRIPREFVPEIETLPGAHHRRDILSDADYAAIAARLPAHHQAPIEGLRVTGWREDELLGLDWPRVDLHSKEIRLEEIDTKTGEARSLSFAEYPPLDELLARQAAVRAQLAAGGVITPWVFPHRNGRRIACSTLQQAWKRAREGAGVVAAEGPFIHGLRRKMSKELLDAGAPEVDAMKVTGHKSASTFRWYALRDRAAQDRALARLHAHRQAQGADPERDRRKVERGSF